MRIAEIYTSFEQSSSLLHDLALFFIFYFFFIFINLIYVFLTHLSGLVLLFTVPYALDARASDRRGRHLLEILRVLYSTRDTLGVRSVRVGEPRGSGRPLSWRRVKQSVSLRFAFLRGQPRGECFKGVGLSSRASTRYTPNAVLFSRHSFSLSGQGFRSGNRTEGDKRTIAQRARE